MSSVFLTLRDMVIIHCAQYVSYPEVQNIQAFSVDDFMGLTQGKISPLVQLIQAFLWRAPAYGSLVR